MYTLRTIADIHPMSLLYNLLEESALAKNKLQELIISIDKTGKQSPEQLAQPAFWQPIIQSIADATARKIHYEKLPEILRQHIRPPWIAPMQTCEAVQAILERHFTEIEKGAYTHLYSEGENPTTNYAQKRGLAVVNLDEGNRYANPRLLQDEKREPRGQWMREGYWIEHIPSEEHINTSLLIVGKSHAQNEFGLVSRLTRKSINLAIVTDSEHIQQEVYRAYR